MHYEPSNIRLGLAMALWWLCLPHASVCDAQPQPDVGHPPAERTTQTLDLSPRAAAATEIEGAPATPVLAPEAQPAAPQAATWKLASPRAPAEPTSSAAAGPDLVDRGAAVDTLAEDPVESAPRFGAAGSSVFSLGLSAHFSLWSASAAIDRGASAAPSIDYFIVRNLALGFEMTFAYRINRGYGADYSLVQTETTLLSAAPRVGWNFTLGDRWSLFPQAAFGPHRTEQHLKLLSGESLSIASSPTGAPSIVRTGPWLSLWVPLLFQIAPHFLLGAGPSLYHDFSRAGGPGAERTTLGASFAVMGFWGGDADRTRRVNYVRVPGSRFGARGTWVLTSEFTLGAYGGGTPERTQPTLASRSVQPWTGLSLRISRLGAHSSTNRLRTTDINRTVAALAMTRRAVALLPASARM